MDHNYIQHLINKLDSSELSHYSSQYYDPEKAHEYYLKNRQLKGRTTSGLSDEGKDIWIDTKANITERKKSEIKAYKDQEELNIKNLRDKAEATRESISKKLKELSEKLAAKYKTDNKSITDKLKAISRNSGLSEEQKDEKREKLYEERDKLSGERREESAKNSEEAKTERTKVAGDLKTAIQYERDMYKKNKESLDSSYDNVYQEEYDKIKSQYAAPIKGRGRSKKK